MKSCQPLFLSLRGAEPYSARRRGNLILCAIIIAVFAFCFASSGTALAASGSTLDFDGIDNYVVADDNSVFDQANRLSISVWIQPDDTPTGDEYIVYRHNNYYLKIDSNRKIIGSVHTDAETVTSVSAITANGTEWTHIEMTYDKDAGGVNELKLYIDGNLDAVGDYSTAITASTKKLYVGAGDTAGNNSPENFFDGKIDDIRLYQYARSLSDVQMDYNNGLAVHFGGSSNNLSVISDQCSSDPASCMDHGLVASYDFDEGDGQTLYNAADTGSANDGTLGSSSSADSADPVWTRPDLGASLRSGLGPTGPSGSALQFDGSNDYVNCGNDASLNITDAITIEAWVKPTSFNDWDSIAFKALTSTNRYGMMLSGSGYGDSNDFFFCISHGANTGGYTDEDIVTLNTWYHVVMVFDGSETGNANRLKGFVNGTQKTLEFLGTIPVTIGSNTSNFELGRSYGDTNKFDGSIDGVKIYNRALSAEEIRYHYNRGAPVAHWRMDEGEGSTLYDETSNNNDGTLHLGSLGNTATSTAWVAGNSAAGSGGSAIDFDGEDDYVSVSDDPALDITDAITVEAWVKPAVLGGVQHRIVHKHSAYSFYIDIDDKLCFWNYNGSQYLPMNDVLTVGDWTHVVATADTTNGITLYRNGVLDVSDSGKKNSLATSDVNLYIGIDEDLSNYNFNGSIDDVKIYNYARTPAQILMDYNAGFSTHLK